MSSGNPHILILMTDQQRADCLSCSGHPMIRTPNMDRIASEGIHFTRAATVSPVCMPARASFINGLYPHNHNMWRNKGAMYKHDETFFHHLQRAGYCTGHIGKSHYYEHHRGMHMRDMEDYMHARGLEYVHETTGPWATVNTDSYMTDLWQEKGILSDFRDDYENKRRKNRFCTDPSPLPVEDFPDSYVGRTAVEYISNYDNDLPMCLFVGFGGPHEPWDAPGEYAAMYDPAQTPPVIPISENLESLPSHVRESGYFDPVDHLTQEDVQRISANYFGKIKLIDDWIGRILEACTARGWLDDMVIVFWSDHGEMLGDHGRLYKSIFFESSIRVPLMVRWPGRIPEGLRSEALAENIDIFPTLLEGLGLEHEGRCQGVSLWPCIENSDVQLRECQMSEVNRNIMVCSERYKYAVDPQARGILLFDLHEDPEEQDNLIGRREYSEFEVNMRDMLLTTLATAQYELPAFQK